MKILTYRDWIVKVQRLNNQRKKVCQSIYKDRSEPSDDEDWTTRAQRLNDNLVQSVNNQSTTTEQLKYKD